MSGSAARATAIRLSALFFLQAHAQALWYVPFSSILRSHGLDWLTPYTFAGMALAALIPPMLGGALADQHLRAERLLGGLCIGVAGMLALVFTAIQNEWGGGWVLSLLFVQQLLFAPAGSLVVAIVLAGVEDPERQYGPIRVWGTYGWLVAAPLLSLVLQVDTSPLAGYIAAAGYLVVAAFAFSLPDSRASTRSASRRWRDLLGNDTLFLLRDRDVRIVFVTAGLFSMPLAAFYPFTPLFLRDVGVQHASAAMSLGQVTEVIASYALAPLFAAVRLKWILLAGLFFGVLRYVLYAMTALPLVYVGISLHGFCYTLFFISAQLYLERRIDPQYRTRAQAFLTLMMLGVGNFAGSLGGGWLRDWCSNEAGTDWRLYWSILAGVALVVLGYFAVRFREEETVEVEPIPGELPLTKLPTE